MPENKEKVNSYLLVIFIYMGVLTIPFKQFFGNGIIVWVFTLLILIIYLLNNKININKLFLTIIFTVSLFFLFNILIATNQNIIIEIFLEFIKFAAIPMFIASGIGNFNKLITPWYHIGIISLIIWIINLDLVINSELNYMTFGVTMTFTFFITCVHQLIYKKNSLFNYLLILTIFVLVLLFANRVSFLLCIIIFIIFQIFKSKNYIRTIIIILGIATISFFIWIKLSEILYLILRAIEKLQINSYTVIKFISAMENGFWAAASGRDDIYIHATELIFKSKGFPMGVGSFYLETGYFYPHNFIYEVIINFGVFGIFVIVFLFYLLGRVLFLSESKEEIFFYLGLMILVFVRLIFSGSYWTETLFWVLIIFILNKRNFMKSKVVD